MRGAFHIRSRLSAIATSVLTLMLLSCAATASTGQQPAQSQPESTVTENPVALAPESLAFFSQLKPGELLSGRFEQQRTLPEIKQPLRSSGHFLFSPGDGLHWQQQQPFDNLIVFTEKQMSQRIAGGAVQITSYREQPVARYFFEVFSALFAGDTAALSQRFNVTQAAGNEGSATSATSLELHPLDPQLQKGIKTIQLRASDQLEQIRIIDQLGGALTLDLSDWEKQQRPLSAQEQALFD